MLEETLRNVGMGIFAMMAVCLVLAMLLFTFFVRRLHHLDIPDDAGFAETLLYVPFSLVLFIDLLDFALDILAAPITWALLDRLGLKALRNVFAFEAIIPFTQAIPAMTIAWVAVRLLGPGAVQYKAVGD